jgi:phosphomannomutase
MSGYSSSSGTIIDIGLKPTPVLSYISSCEKTLGVMVTASHNPPSNNGFKFFLNGSECGELFEKELERELQLEHDTPNFTTSTLNSWNNVGECIYYSNNNLIDDYLNYLFSKIHIDNFDSKIILDCANNVPNLVSPNAFYRLGFKNVITINDNLDASFPGRPSEPSSGNLSLLKRKVIEEKADIGIAHDGDGDRFAIIDEKGNFVSSTSLICFFIDHLDYSDPDRSKIILTSDCTKQAIDLVEKNGGTVVLNQIGKNRAFVNDNSVLFLAEPNKLIFPDLGKWIDGLFPVLKLLEMSKLKQISDLLPPYDERKILRKAFTISEGDRIHVKQLIDNLPELWYDKIINISSLDGLKLMLKDDSSILIRFSGTEPKVKFYIESSSIRKNEGILNQIISEFKFTTPIIDC